MILEIGFRVYDFGILPRRQRVGGVVSGRGAGQLSRRLGFRVSGFGYMISGIRFRVHDFGASGFHHGGRGSEVSSAGAAPGSFLAGGSTV
jgi:hypothetical protein